MVQDDKKFCLSRTISQEPYIIWSSFMLQMYVWKDNISRHFFFFPFKILIFKIIRGVGAHVWNGDNYSKFFHFSKSWFLGFYGGKRAKNDLKLPISVCFVLYLRNCRSYRDFDDICRCFSLLIFFKCNIVNINCIFIGPLQQFF